MSDRSITLELPIPLSSTNSVVVIESYDSIGWTGLLDNAPCSEKWGTIPAAPWIQLSFVNGKLSYQEMLPTRSNERISMYTLDDDSTVFVLRLTRIVIPFPSLTNLLQHVFDNLIVQNMFGTSEPEYALVSRFIRDHELTITHDYRLHGDSLMQQDETLRLGWISPGSKRTLMGRARPEGTLRSGCAKWSCEAVSDLDDPVTLIVSRLLAGLEWGDEIFAEISTDEVLPPSSFVGEPTYSDAVGYNGARIRYALKNPNRDGADEVLIGSFLNAPVVLFYDQDDLPDIIAYPSKNDLFRIADDEPGFAQEIWEMVYEVFLSDGESEH